MLRYLNTIRLRATRMFLTVAAIMVPVMVLVYVAERLGLVSELGNQIAQSMEEQRTVMTEIAGKTADISEMSGRYLQIAHELQVNSQQLKNNSEGLKVQIDRFKI